MNVAEISLQRFVGRFFRGFLVEVFLIYHLHKFLLGECLVEFFLQFFLGRDLSSDIFC